MNGRYVVACVCLGSFFVSVSKAQVAGWKLVRTLPLQGPVNHVQGIEFDDRVVWVTSVDAVRRKGFLWEFALDSGQMLRVVEIQNGPQFHPGGIAADATSLWIPVAEYRPHSTSTIQKRNKQTLALEFQFRVADHTGCIAVTPEYLIGGNWDSRDFYFWDQGGRLVRMIQSDTQNAYQDMKFDAPHLIASGLLGDRTGAIDWLDLPSLRLTRRVHAGLTDRQTPLTREGMAIHGDGLLLLPEDQPTRLFVFRKNVD